MRSLWCAALLAACAEPAEAPPPGPWMRPGLVGEMSAAYFTVPNAGSDTLRLTGVEIDAAAHASFHRTIDSAGTARMVAQDTIAIAPRDSAVLAPRGLHVMAHGLRVPLAAGDTVVIRVFTSRRDTLLVRAAVRE
ncbi:MAG: copper chaperone PCu(A)C [Gemmatimonadaceae bacterium]|nr:copper chaperone PCu(A)C [Gemmatimonadaceae bacterium]